MASSSTGLKVREAVRLHGAEAIGKQVNIIVPPELKAAHERGFEHWRRRGRATLDRRIELGAMRKDGSPVDIELWMSVTHVRGVPHIHSNIRDISERKKQAALLMAAKADAEAASVAKSTFLTNMSHELRSPLNGVIGVCDLLAKTTPPAHQQELISIIQSSSGQLSRLIGDVLDLARVEAGKFVPAQAPMLLFEIVDGVRDVSAPDAHKKGISLISELDTDTGMPVLGDALCLKQVLTNLVSNAVKFTETGSVKIAVTRSEAGYRFAVSDTGIGFDEDARAVLFQRFQQADESITRRFGGTGLGLAISRELVAAMGGELDCVGQPGAGRHSGSRCRCTTRRHFMGSRRFQMTRASPSAAYWSLMTTLQIGGLRNFSSTPVGAEAVCVDDGQQAVDAFLHGRYDTILMDMMIPVMDGVAATQAIRNLEIARQLPRTPIVMLTANTLPEHIDASLAAGADLHLAKPVNAASLFEALDELANVFAEQRLEEEITRVAG